MLKYSRMQILGYFYDLFQKEGKEVNDIVIYHEFGVDPIFDCRQRSK